MVVNKRSYYSCINYWSSHTKTETVLMFGHSINTRIYSWPIMSISSVENTIISNHTSVGPYYFTGKMLAILALSSIPFQNALRLAKSSGCSPWQILNLFRSPFSFFKIKWAVEWAIQIVCSIFLIEISGFSVTANETLFDFSSLEVFSRYYRFFSMHHILLD